MTTLRGSSLLLAQAEMLFEFMVSAMQPFGAVKDREVD